MLQASPTTGFWGQTAVEDQLLTNLTHRAQVRFLTTRFWYIREIGTCSYAKWKTNP